MAKKPNAGFDCVVSRDGLDAHVSLKDCKVRVKRGRKTLGEWIISCPVVDIQLGQVDAQYLAAAGFQESHDSGGR